MWTPSSPGLRGAPFALAAFAAFAALDASAAPPSPASPSLSSSSPPPTSPSSPSASSLSSSSLSSSPPPSAQDGHVFSAAKDLEGFEAADLGEFHELYALAEFTKLDGQTLGEAQLAELRQRWSAERARVKPRIEAIRADPRERWIWQLEKKLAQHGYFSKIAWTLERPAPGFVLLVQRPAKDDPGYAARLAAFYQPSVARLASEFEQRFAAPAGIVRRAEQPVTAYAVLASKGDLDNLTRFVQDPTGYVAGTTYDYQLQLAVSYEDPFATDVPPEQKRGSLLYQVAKELEHAWLGVPGNRPGSIWLYEGLALYLALHEGTTPEALERHAPRPRMLERMAGLVAKAPERELLLLPIDELVELRSWQDYQKAVAARVKAAGADDPDDQDLAGAYFGQCELWMHYLLDGGQGAYQKSFLEFVKAAFTGRGGAAELRQAFPGTDPGAFSRDALRWTLAEYERAWPGRKADRAPIEALFRVANAAPAAASSAAPAQSRPAELVPASFAPRMLAPADDDAEAQLALALQAAREGDLAGAEQVLQSLSAQVREGEWPARIERERTRLAELGKLREAYLGWLRASGSKLAFKHKGKDVMALVTGVENGLVKLGENKLGLPSIPLSALDPYEIAKVAAKREQQGAAAPWTRAYAYVLAGDARWDKLVKDDSAAAKELRADAPSVAGLLRAAQAARELYELSRLPLPRTKEDSSARLERIHALLAAHREDGPVVRRDGPLRDLARAALVAGLDPGDASALLHAKAEPLEDGRTRFTWNFDAAEEALDWRRQLGYLASWRARFKKITVSEADSAFRVEQGRWRGTGQVCYRLAASFQGPITVRLRYRYESTTAEHGPAAFYLMVCDDAKGSYVIAGDPGFLIVRDLASDWDREAHSSEKGEYYLDEDLEFELVHDGKEVATALDGRSLAKAGCGPRTAGDVVLFSQMDAPVSIDRIVIEGTPQPDSMRELRARWVEERLAALGFR